LGVQDLGVVIGGDGQGIALLTFDGELIGLRIDRGDDASSTLAFSPI